MKNNTECNIKVNSSPQLLQRSNEYGSIIQTFWSHTNSNKFLVFIFENKYHAKPSLAHPSDILRAILKIKWKNDGVKNKIDEN